MSNRLVYLKYFIVLLLFATCANQEVVANTKEGDNMIARNTSIYKFFKSDLWLQYKNLYKEIRLAKSNEAVSELSNRADKLFAVIDSTHTDISEFTSNLSGLMTVLINERRTGLMRHKGRQPKPDYIKLMRLAIHRMDIKLNLVETISKITPTISDQWVKIYLYKSLIEDKDDLISNIKLINKDANDGYITLTTEEEKVITEAKKSIHLVDNLDSVVSE